MTISLIICTYNRADLLPFCLNSIKDQSASPLSFEVVIVNNNCTDNTQEVVGDFISQNPHLSITSAIETNQGLSHSRNRGILESKTPFVAYVDDDAILDLNYVQNCISFIQSNPSCKAFGGPIFVRFLSNPPSWENKYVNSMFGYFNPSEEPFQFDKSNYPRGSNMIFRRDLFQHIGNFNTDLGRVKRGLVGNEEKDIFQRIYAATDEVYYRPELIVYHIAPEERTTKKFVKRQAMGTGYGEYTRTWSSGRFKYLYRWLTELFKWVGTLVLSFIFLLRGSPDKGWILIQFRFWISKGLMGINPDNAT